MLNYSVAELRINKYFYAFFLIKKLARYKIITNFVQVKTVKLH